MVSKLQAYMTGEFFKGSSIWILFAVLTLCFGIGCATVGSVATIQTKGYEEYVQEVENSLKSSPRPFTTGFYLHGDVKKKVLETSVKNIQKGEIEVADLNLMRKEYLNFTRALVEIGEFKKARAVCDDGIQVGVVISKALEQQGKRDAVASLSRAITLSIFNTSIEPEDDNGAYLRRLFLYKTYITWFETGNKKKAFDEFEQFLKTTSLNEDRVFLLMDRGFFYDAIMGDYKKSLDEFIEAAAGVEKMHILNTDMRYLYSLELSVKISDIYVKLGQLDKAEKVLLDGDAQRSGLIYKIGGLIASLQQSKLSVVRSKMGALYALMRDFDTSKKYFDEAFDRVKRLDPDSHDVDHQRALGTYNVYYGAYYLGLKGKYGDAAEQVDKGLVHLKPYFLDAVQNDPNLETAYLHSAELHLLAGENNGNGVSQKEHYEKALTQTRKVIKYAESHHNKVAELAAYTLSGRIHYAKGEKKQAKVSYEKAYKLSKKHHIESTENWKLFYGLGQVYEYHKEQEQALKYYKLAVDEVEKLWDGRFKDAQKQVSFIDNRLVVFEPLIRILANQGKADEVVYNMERSKSRTFFESSVFSEKSGENAKLPEMSPADAEKLEKIRTEISQLSKKIDEQSSRIQDVSISLGEETETASSRGMSGVREVKKSKKSSITAKKLSNSEKRRLENEKAAYEKERNDLSNRLDELAKQEQTLPDKAGRQARDISNIKILTATEIRRFIPDKMALIEYYVGEETVIGAVITKNNVFVKELKIGPKKLKDQIMAYRYDLENVLYNYKENGLILYDELVRPFEKHLADVQQVGIIPHGVLHYLPFQALVEGDESERGIDPQLIETEKTLLAMRDCSSDRPNRGLGGVRQAKPSGPVVQDCKTMKATRGLKIKDIKGADQKTDLSDQDVRAELEAVRSRIATERNQKGVSDSRPTFLIDKYKIFYAPNSSILKFVHTQNTGRIENLLALGSPPAVDIKDLNLKDEDGNVVKELGKLENAKAEVQKVGALFDKKLIFTDEAATETLIMNKAPQSDIILLSAHGLLHRTDPMKSAVFFNKDSSNNGRLTVSEVENLLRINSNLVALSACETGLVSGYEGVGDDIADAKFPHGDDLVGLQRAFMKAGSASVMSTLWQVADDSTSVLMVDFFKRFNKGTDKVTALQEAALDLMKTNRDWEHPYFWAPFVLSGDWR